MKIRTSCLAVAVTLGCFGISLLGCSGSSQNQAAPAPAESPSAGTESPNAVAAQEAAAAPRAAEAVAQTPPAAPAAAPNSDISTMTKEELVERMQLVMESIVEAAKANEGNCDGFADDVTKIVDSNQGIGARVEELEQDPESKAWLQAESQRMQQEMQPKMQPLMGVLVACQDNARVQELGSKLGSM